MSIAVLLFLVCTAAAQSTTNKIDIFGQLISQQEAKLILVQKLVDVDYHIKIDNPDRYQQYPDMFIQFNLKYPQLVSFKYQIAVQTNEAAFFVTRLIVDGVERNSFRDITANKYHFHSNKNDGKLWLQKGKHTAKIEYRSNSPVINWHPCDWCVYFFKVSYYQLKAQ